ncbi:MAG: type II toxin-antitoxin system RelE/ParE family toxin [Rhodospirillales bacterium]|jgi:plasmid stabilization system protein ParE|nr:type II toxin-antitoxin system RelE/ParE family toxin [Rhodospirillales bacterium]MDP6645967.1 type II toxin-antitoxin system RelE/ParE family toxin [Rhodospirillales bacterium]|tara:strand:- start:444 stop:725 length:282 start_codon:yes stop_codon:yes gene_type:complete
MNIVWSPRARVRMIELREYIAEQNPYAADAVAKRILAAIVLLADFPQMGRPGRLDGTRELILPEISIVIPYRVTRNRLEIVTVQRAEQKWPPG